LREKVLSLCAVCAIVCLAAAYWASDRLSEKIPELSSAEAAVIIQSSPMFNRYARLLKVLDLDHAKDSLEYATFGSFTFRFLGSPPDATPISGSVEFQFHEGKWYLDQFRYGCPKDCHTVEVHDGPPKQTR
jgi:hypothetical protein